MTEELRNSHRREKVEKEGFFDDDRKHGVVSQARWQQTTLLEETRGQTVPHAPPRASA